MAGSGWPLSDVSSCDKNSRQKDLKQLDEGRAECSMLDIGC